MGADNTFEETNFNPEDTSQDNIEIRLQHRGDHVQLEMEGEMLELVTLMAQAYFGDEEFRDVVDALFAVTQLRNEDEILSN